MKNHNITSCGHDYGSYRCDNCGYRVEDQAGWWCSKHYQAQMRLADNSFACYQCMQEESPRQQYDRMISVYSKCGLIGDKKLLQGIQDLKDGKMSKRKWRGALWQRIKGWFK